MQEATLYSVVRYTRWASYYVLASSPGRFVSKITQVFFSKKGGISPQRNSDSVQVIIGLIVSEGVELLSIHCKMGFCWN